MNIEEKDKAKIIAADVANIVRKVKAGRPLSKMERNTILTASTKLGLAPNMRAAAVKVGSTPRVLKAMKAAGSKAWRDRGDIDCDVLAAELKAGPVAEPMPTEGELLLRERRLALADKRDRANRVTIHQDEVKRECTRYVTAMKSRLMAMGANVETSMKAECGLSDAHAQALRRIVAGEARDVLESLTRGDWFKDK